jgi:hypothetical protein
MTSSREQSPGDRRDTPSNRGSETSSGKLAWIAIPLEVGTLAVGLVVWRAFGGHTVLYAILAIVLVLLSVACLLAVRGK